MQDETGPEAEAPRTGLLIETTWDQVPVGTIVTVPKIDGAADTNAKDGSSDAGMAFYICNGSSGKEGIPLREYRPGDRPESQSGVYQTFQPKQRLVIREIVSNEEIESARERQLEHDRQDVVAPGRNVERINQVNDEWRRDLEKVLESGGAAA